MSLLDHHADRPALEAEARRMLALLERLWPIHRSLAGPGIRDTLAILGASLDGFTVSQVASGCRVLDWVVPDEWHLRSAWLEAPDGRRLCNVADNTLHVLGYSTAVDARLSLAELQPHLYSLPDQPEAIPYVTSYYERKWGFCLSHRER